MKKNIDLNKDQLFKKEILVYLGITLFLCLAVEGWLRDDTSFIHVLELNSDQLRRFINVIELLIVLCILSAVLVYLIMFVSKYVYAKYKYGLSFDDTHDFLQKCNRIENGLRTALRRSKANIDDVYPDVILKYDKSSYILELYKNHWFNKDQIDRSTDFFKSVMKLPLYSTEEDYNKVSLTFTALKTLMPYKKLRTQFHSSVEEGILIGHNGEKPKYWDYNTVPHLLGAGTTGSGKSNFMKIVVDGLEEIGASIKFADGKRVELIRYRFKGYEVYTEDFPKMFKAVHKIMSDRYKRMEQETEELRHEVNHYTRLQKPPKPYFLVIDEWASIFDNLSKVKPNKTEESPHAYCTKLAKDILQLGRASGVFVVAFMQDPKAETLNTSLRNNFNARILLGRVKEKTAYDIIFGSEYRNLEPVNVGKGYFMSDDEPRVLEIPLWEDLEAVKAE